MHGQLLSVSGPDFRQKGGSTMRAVVVDEFGGPEKLVVNEVADPSPGAGEVLVAVAAAGVNRADVLARSGRYHRAGPPPLILGLECAGTVLAVGRDVTGVQVGERVLAWGATNEPGFYAESAVVPASAVQAIPAGVDSVSAACLPAAWLSAWYVLQHLAQVRPGEIVLIHAAASGVGSAAVQIAAQQGATVIGTVGSTEKQAWVGDLGAEQVFNTSELDRQQVLDEILRASDGRGADVVIDTVGGDTFADSLRAAAYAGRVVAMANVALQPSLVDTRDFYPKNVRILGFQITALMEHGYDPAADLAALLAGVAAGTYTVPVAATFDLVDAPAAHRLLESRRTRGKVVLTVGSAA